jgi:hypothetical protein
VCGERHHAAGIGAAAGRCCCRWLLLHALLPASTAAVTDHMSVIASGQCVAIAIAAVRCARSPLLCNWVQWQWLLPTARMQ